MVTVEDLSSGGSLPSPMVVEVRDVEWKPSKSRRAEVSLVDTKGNVLNLIDYDGAELSIEWKPGHHYRISRCGVTEGNDGYQLAPSKKTSVESLGPGDDTTQLLVFGDTHVGREVHPGSGEPIEPIDPFSTVVEYAIGREVDAIIHTGDIFHDSATKEHAKEAARDVFVPLETKEVPFYYVEGNHGSDVSKKHLKEKTGDMVRNLDLSGSQVGQDVRIYGMDHCDNGDVDWRKVRFPETMDEDVSILVLHQTLKALTGDTEKSIQIDQFQRRASAEFDLVVSGHHHDANRDDKNGSTVMYAGAAEQMSKNNDPVDRVAWVVQIENGTVVCNRYDIP